jgi:hypothetical protein
MKKIPLYCHHDKLVPAETLRAKLHPQNPKAHGAEQLRLYAKIIRANGWRRAVVLSARSGFVVKGNGAVLACLAHGILDVPIETQPYASELEELRDLNADNALSALGETDEPKLAALLENLGDTDHELAGILKQLEEGQAGEITSLDIKPVPTYAWLLVGMPIQNFGRLTPAIEMIRAMPDAVMETSCNNDAPQAPTTGQPEP